jgi:peptidyl-prolyl cis-trans isomerase SurA
MRAPALLVLLVVLVLVVLLGAGGAHAQQGKPAASSPVTIERVGAIVNDQVILESEIVQRATPMLGEVQTTDPKERAREWRALMRRTIDQMIDEELILDAAQESKIEVTGEEVQKALDEIKRQNRLTDTQLDQALVQQGTTLAEYRKDVRRQILRLRAVSMLVRPRVNVSDEDVKARHEKVSGQSAVATEVHMRHILLALPDRPSAAQVDAARRRAGELVDRARAGEDFAELVREASQDPATKGEGGDLGWYKRGELPTEWEEIIFTMSQGEVRGPIQGPRGLHVFQLLETRAEAVRPFDEVKEQLHEQIFQEEMERQTKTWLQELRKKAHVEVKI